MARPLSVIELYVHVAVSDEKGFVKTAKKASIWTDICCLFQVLYHMFEAYVEMGEENVAVTDIMKGLASFLVVAIGGTVIGIVWGFLTGFVTRFTNHARVLEPLFVFVMAYMSYLNAEIFHMSGILA